MDTNDCDKNLEYVVENEQLNSEQIQSNACSIDETNILTTNNITTTVETDPLELAVDIGEHYGLKPCSVKLARCDNIWKTLQLIRDLQHGGNSERENDDNGDGDDHDDGGHNGDGDNKIKVKQEEDEPSSSMNDNESYSSSTQANNIMPPYIKYQPVLNNGNSALNFQFSVKSTRFLYQCHECGKQYSHRSTLREHSERIHNLVLPMIRKKPENTNNDSKKIQLRVNNEFQGNNDVNRDEMSSISTDIHENSTTDLQDDGALLDNASDTQLSDKELLTSAEDKIYRCLSCNRQYKDKYYFNYHLKHAHGTSIAGIRSYKKRTTPNSNNINNNNINTNEQRSLIKSRRVQQIDQSRNLNVHRCNTCGKHFYDKARLGDHLRKVHGIYRRNRINNRIQSLKTNNKKVTTNSSVAQSGINKTNSHDNDDRVIHQCTFCEKSYADRQCWKKHLQSIHDIKIATYCRTTNEPGRNMTCKECGREYLWKRSLIEHLFTVHGQRLQHECDTCGLWFQNIDTLIKHALDIHKIMLIQRIVRRAKDRPYKCQVCFTHYGLKKNLMWHLLEAHGIRNISDVKNIKTEPTDETHDRPTTRRRLPPSPRTLRKGLRDKARINYNEATESRSVEQLLLGETVRNKENDDASENIGNAVLCFLCQRRCIKIRRHFMEYHKIRQPEALIAQCKPVSSTSVIENNDIANVRITRNVKPNIKKENVTREVRRARVRVGNNRNINNNPNRLFTKITSEHGSASYKCKICPNYVRGQYEMLRKHEKIHRRQEIHMPISNGEIENNELTITRKRKRVSADNRDTRRPRLSDLVEHTRTTRASIKLKEEREFRCTTCDRLFRNAEILSSHKISCVAYHGENSSMNDASDTRESSDRDSGIGISITIKKRNNSYEIVGREGNEEEKLPNFPEKNGELKDDASVSDNSSEAFAIMTNNKDSDPSEKSIPYSKNHTVIKIQKGDDIDIDIDLESISSSPMHIECENNHEVTSSDQRDTTDISKCRIIEAEPHQVLSLKQLCENVLAKTKNSEEFSYKCNVCSKMWSSRAARSAHMRIHPKSTRS